jgi:LacI family transcriptional regulator
LSQRPTLKHISERAGVSTFAVSQALTGKPGVAEVTRERIAQIAEELGYVPNAIAAGLKAQSTKAIGVMTASGRNQYYSMLVQAIDGLLQHSGYYAVTNDAMRGGAYSPELENSSVEQLLQQRVAAVIATYSLSRESLLKIGRWGIPVVFVDSLPPNHAPGAPFVGVDNFTASSLVAEHFSQVGYTKVAFLAYPADWNTRTPRQAGFVEKAAELGLEVEILESQNSAESAFDAVNTRLALESTDWPEAIYASNTLLLQGTLRALRERSLSVPKDMGILAFDDFDWAEFIDPPITVVDQHIDKIGRLAAETVIGLVEGQSPPMDGLHIEVQPNLVVRKSCVRPLP